MMIKVDWKYIAGFLDADGTAGLYRRKKKRAIEPHLRFINKCIPVHIEIINFLKGYNVYSAMAKQSNKKDISYATQVFSMNGIETILTNCLPFLIVKKGQAKLLLKFIRIRKSKWIEGHYPQRGLSKGTSTYGEEEEEVYHAICLLNLESKGRRRKNE